MINKLYRFGQGIGNKIVSFFKRYNITYLLNVMTDILSILYLVINLILVLTNDNISFLKKILVFTFSTHIILILMDYLKERK